MDKRLERDLEAGKHVAVTPVARAANVAPGTIRAMIERGEIKGCVQFGRVFRIPAPEARRLLGLEPAA